MHNEKGEYKYISPAVKESCIPLKQKAGTLFQHIIEIRKVLSFKPPFFIAFFYIFPFFSKYFGNSVVYK
jgi:hypothetical protein